MMYLTDSRRQWIRPAHAGTTGVRTRVLPGEVPMMRHRRWRRCCPDSSRARAAIGDPGCRVRPQRSSPEPWWRMRVCRGAQTSASSSVAMLAGHRCPRVSQWFSALVRGTRRIVSGCGPLHVLRPGPPSDRNVRGPRPFLHAPRPSPSLDDYRTDIECRSPAGPRFFSGTSRPMTAPRLPSTTSALRAPPCGGCTTPAVCTGELVQFPDHRAR